MFTYRVKVPAQVRRYLIGSHSVQKKIDSHHYLFFRVDDDGNALKIGRSKFDIGGNIIEEVLVTTLQPGEGYIVQLDDVVGIWAECPFDTIVQCAIDENT